MNSFTEFALAYAGIDDQKLKNYVSYLSELILLDLQKLSHHPPSTMAFAVIIISLHCLDYHPWPAKLAKLSNLVGVDFSDYVPAMLDLYKCLTSAIESKCAVYLKYNSNLKLAVSSIPLPDSLPILIPL